MRVCIVDVHIYICLKCYHQNVFVMYLYLSLYLSDVSLSKCGPHLYLYLFVLYLYLYLYLSDVSLSKCGPHLYLYLFVLYLYLYLYLSDVSLSKCGPHDSWWGEKMVSSLSLNGRYPANISSPSLPYLAHKHMYKYKDTNTNTNTKIQTQRQWLWSVWASVGKDAAMACAQFVIVNNPDVGLSWNREHGNTISQSKNFPAHETKKH